MVTIYVQLSSGKHSEYECQKAASVNAAIAKMLSNIDAELELATELARTCLSRLQRISSLKFPSHLIEESFLSFPDS